MTEQTLTAAIEAMPPAERRGALKALDMCTRPMQAREIETALRLRGIPRSRAAILAGSLKGLAIVAVTGIERTEA